MSDAVGPELSPQLALQASPELIAYVELLALPMLALQDAVERELEENPALELVDRTVCSRCGDPVLGTCCLTCDGVVRRPTAPLAGSGTATLPDVRSPIDILLAEVSLSVDAHDHPIVEFLIGSLDDRGRLRTSVDEASAMLGVESARTRAVLSTLQQAGPPGIAAVSLRECLLLQLDRCERGGLVRDLARAVVSDHLEQLAKGQYASVAHSLGVSRSEVLAARDFIRAKLNPYPLTDVEIEAAPVPALRPDIVIRERRVPPVGLEVDLVEPRRFEFRVNPVYEQLLSDGVTGRDRRRIEGNVQAAREFLRRIGRRWETMRAVAEILVERQQEFVRRGPQYLLPMTRAEVAHTLGVHESTVGRAVAERNALLPSGRIVPLAQFFDAPMAPCHALARLIAVEDHPKSDNELARDLESVGLKIARRTVTKYRQRLGILPHTMR